MFEEGHSSTYMQWDITQLIERMKYAFWSNMDGPGDYHIKWSKSDRERKICMTLFICGILKKKKNLFTRQKETQRLKERIYGYCGRMMREGIDD